MIQRRGRILLLGDQLVECRTIAQGKHMRIVSGLEGSACSDRSIERGLGGAIATECHSGLSCASRCHGQRQGDQTAKHEGPRKI